LKNKPLVLGEEIRGLYLIKSETNGTLFQLFVPHNHTPVPCLSLSKLWHCKLGHPSSQHIAKIQSLPYKSPTSICSVCPQAKQHRSSFPLSTTLAVKTFELLHVDIWGPYKTVTYDGYKLFLSIIDDYSRATWVFLFSHKSNAFSMLVSFISYIETQFPTQVQVIRSDN